MLITADVLVLLSPGLVLNQTHAAVTAIMPSGGVQRKANQQRQTPLVNKNISNGKKKQQIALGTKTVFSNSRKFKILCVRNCQG